MEGARARRAREGESLIAPLGSAGIRAIALLEGAKGMAVLVGGFGLVALVHRDLEYIAEVVIRHLHLNPANHYPSIFIQLAANTSDTRLWAYAAMAMAYATIRLAEGYGLWHGRRWAEWLAVVSGAIYLPFEAYEVLQGKGWVAVAALGTNAAIVLVMIRALRRRTVPNALA